MASRPANKRAFPKEISISPFGDNSSGIKMAVNTVTGTNRKARRTINGVCHRSNRKINEIRVAKIERGAAEHEQEDRRPHIHLVDLARTDVFDHEADRHRDHQSADRKIDALVQVGTEEQDQGQEFEQYLHCRGGQVAEIARMIT